MNEELRLLMKENMLYIIRIRNFLTVHKRAKSIREIANGDPNIQKFTKAASIMMREDVKLLKKKKDYELTTEPPHKAIIKILEDYPKEIDRSQKTLTLSMKRRKNNKLTDISSQMIKESTLIANKEYQKIIRNRRGAKQQIDFVMEQLEELKKTEFYEKLPKKARKQLEKKWKKNPQSKKEEILTEENL